MSEINISAVLEDLTTGAHDSTFDFDSLYLPSPSQISNNMHAIESSVQLMDHPNNHESSNAAVTMAGNGVVALLPMAVSETGVSPTAKMQRKRSRSRSRSRSMPHAEADRTDVATTAKVQRKRPRNRSRSRSMPHAEAIRAGVARKSQPGRSGTATKKSASRYPNTLSKHVPSLDNLTNIAYLNTLINMSGFIRFVRLAINECSTSQIVFSFRQYALLRLKYEAVAYVYRNLARFCAIYIDLKYDRARKPASIIVQPSHIHKWFSVLYNNYYGTTEAEKLCKTNKNGTVEPKFRVETTRRAVRGVDKRSRRQVTDASCVLVSAITREPLRDFLHALEAALSQDLLYMPRDTRKPMLKVLRISKAAMIEINQVFAMATIQALRFVREITSLRTKNNHAIVDEPEIKLAFSYMYPCEGQLTQEEALRTKK